MLSTFVEEDVGLDPNNITILIEKTNTGYVDLFLISVSIIPWQSYYYCVTVRGGGVGQHTK